MGFSQPDKSGQTGRKDAEQHISGKKQRKPELRGHKGPMQVFLKTAQHHHNDPAGLRLL
jgi:hypothetical protein